MGSWEQNLLSIESVSSIKSDTYHRILCVVLFLGFYERKIREEKMKRMAIFIDFKFEDLEVMYPKIRLEEEGVEVHVVGVHPKGMKYTGKSLKGRRRYRDKKIS